MPSDRRVPSRRRSTTGFPPISTLFGILTVLFCLSPTVGALNNTSVRPRAIYQVVTDRFARQDLSTTASCPQGSRNYCGGNWRGLISRLGYIQGMGFDTIWISPIVQNIDGYTHWGEAFHGYWTQDPTQLNSHFGNSTDLLALSNAIHAKGMYLMVDVVVNHVATTQNLYSFSPNGQYGPLNNSQSFHSPKCFIDYSNQTSIEQCSLGDSYVPLPDINTENSAVVTFWNNWIKKTVQTYKIDAIRIDTVKHIRQSFWPGFTASAGVYNVGEVFDGDPNYVAPYQSNGNVNPFNYPAWYPLISAFQQTSGNLNNLVWNIGQIQAVFKDVGLLGMFVNNHDNPRFESLTQDLALRRNVHAYPFVTDGIPIVYYGSEAGFSGGADPNNREAFWPTGYNTSLPLYSFFTKLSAARRIAGKKAGFYTSKMSMSVIGNNEVLIVKQPLVSILSNRGAVSSTSSNYTLSSTTTGWKANTVIKDVVSGKQYKTSANGTLSVGIVNGQPLVLMDAALK